jgi:hypothetical protein
MRPDGSGAPGNGMTAQAASVAGHTTECAGNGALDIQDSLACAMICWRRLIKGTDQRSHRELHKLPLDATWHEVLAHAGTTKIKNAVRYYRGPRSDLHFYW